MAVLARVDELWVFPVKSMSGSRLDAADVLPTGLAGDRSWAVVGPEGDTVTAKQEPRLRQAVARLVDGELRVELPGGGRFDGSDAEAALSDWLGRELRLEHRTGSGFVDVAPVHVVSTRALEDATHAEDCEACDLTAPRANLVLDLDADVSSERDWVGRTLRAGGTTLTVSRIPKHCLGAYADVVTPGALRVGDEVRTG